jgi:hypothetical protein
MEFSGARGKPYSASAARLKMPLVTTLHTVLREPDPDQLRVMEEIAELSDRLIVMSQLSSQFLQEIFKVPGSKIDMVPHGVPDLPFWILILQRPVRSGRKSGSAHVRPALAEQGNRKCDSGAAADFVQAQECRLPRRGSDPSSRPAPRGRKIPSQLASLAKEVGVESQVMFHNRFASPEEMAEFIGARTFTSPLPA